MILQSEPEGKVVTFYSFKGGVGRSMALANTAVLLARDHGKRVVVVDWDLEAPGLHRFFKIPDADIRDGLVDYFLRYKDLLREPSAEVQPSALDVAGCLIPVKQYSGGGNIRLLAAGAQVDRGKYAERVNQFDWARFYEDWKGGSLIELIRQQLKKEADFVLIDSRTGITDIGGICTLQLPDTLVFVFAFNNQNIDGIEAIARDMSGANPFSEVVKRRPQVLLLPSRKELAEISELRTWEARAADKLGRYISQQQVDAYGSAVGYLREVAIPYVPWFAFGEELAADSDKGFEMVKSYKLMVGLLTGNQGQTGERREVKRRWLAPRWLTRRNIVTAALVVATAALAVDLVRTQRKTQHLVAQAESREAKTREVLMQLVEETKRLEDAQKQAEEWKKLFEASKPPPNPPPGPRYSVILASDRDCPTAKRTFAAVRRNLGMKVPELDLQPLGLAESVDKRGQPVWVASYGRDGLDLDRANKLVKQLSPVLKRPLYSLQSDLLTFGGSGCKAAAAAGAKD